MHRHSIPRFLLCSLLALASALLAGCEFDVPLSSHPDRPIDEKLLGNWSSPDGWAKLARYDAQNFVLLYNGGIYRAWHTPVAGLDLLTLQRLDAASPKDHYLSYAWTGAGRRLDVRFVRDDLLDQHATDPAAMRQAIEQHAGHAKLLSQPVPFARLE